MMHSARSLGLASVVAASLGVALVAAPREAHAQFRVGGYAGIERLGQAGGGGSVAGTLRAQASIGLLPFIHLGAYAESLTDLGGNGKTGSEFGGIAELRLALPATPIDPLAFLSAGYQHYPVNDHTADGWVGQLGVGLVYHAGALVDLEARAALVQVLSQPTPEELNGTGYAFSIGLGLHI